MSLVKAGSGFRKADMLVLKKRLKICFTSFKKFIFYASVQDANKASRLRVSSKLALQLVPKKSNAKN